MQTLKETVEEVSARVLSERKPNLHKLIREAVQLHGQTPADVDRFIFEKYGLPKGHPIRDVCYMTARHFAQQPHPAERGEGERG